VIPVAIAIPPEVVALGAVTGLTYGLLAVGLLLAYRASRVINFAHGQVGAVAAVVLGVMVQQWGVPYWTAFVAVLALGAALSALVEVTVVRRLRSAPPLMTLVATLGVAQFLLSVTATLSGGLTSGRQFPQPTGLPSTDFGALRLTPAIVAMLVFGPLAVAALAYVLTRTPLGVAIRASADNADAARLLGIRAPRMRTLAWALAGALAAFTAALILPASIAATNTNALGPTLMLRGLAAAVLARMSSLPVALAAGLGIGMVEQVAIWNSPDGGVADVLVFGMLLVALLVRPLAGGRLAQRPDWTALVRWVPLRREARAVPLVRIAAPAFALVLLAAAVGGPLLLDGARQLSATTVVCYAIVGLSVWVVTALGGQLSLGQVALAGVGAMFLAGIAETTGSPLIGLLCAPIAGAAVAVAIGLPALRSQESLLPVATLGFAVAAEAWLFTRDWALGGGVHVDRLALGPLDTGKPSGAFLLSMVALVVGLALVRNISRSGFGRRLRAVRDNEQAARAFGVPASLVRIQAFAISGALAALGGAVLTLAVFRITPATFPAGGSIDVVAMTVLGGLAVVAGPLVGALYISALPVFVTLSSAGLAATAFGWLVLVLFVPGGLAALLEPLRRRAVRGLLRLSGQDPALADPVDDDTRDEAIPAPRVGGDREQAAAVQDDDTQPVLELRGLVRHFGGVKAVDGVDLAVAPREVVGLVGPNGAGKTTLFDLASGLVAPQVGRVVLAGEDVTAVPTASRAARGMVRSFQDATLFPTLTVTEVVALGLERRDATRVLPAAAGFRRAERRKLARAGELVDYLGLRRWAHTPVHQLSTGTRRVAELACLLALEPRVLLLDEPSGGLAQREAEALVGLLARLRTELGAAMLVIDHDLPLVLGLADRVVVLAEGRVVTQGEPEAVRDDPLALAALGAMPGQRGRGPARETVAEVS
jgi:ABC-type branched-subunit amino acid transport system ATPase component/branched-subunit amino acid ABC-type transport system permease component